MTTLREAAQMALDALEQMAKEGWLLQGPEGMDKAQTKCVESIEALRAALAQPEQEIESDRPHVEDDGCPTEKAVLQRFWREHQKQEPVAWMYDWYDETEDIDGVPIGGIVHDWISKDYDEAHSPTMGCHNIRPLYTAPPQREWVGLTDEEMMVAAFQAGFDVHEDYDNEDDPDALHWWSEDGERCDDTLHKLRDIIEAKLKEKNA